MHAATAAPPKAESAPSPREAFLARVPKSVAPFDTEAWYARRPELRKSPRIPLPGGRFLVGAAAFYRPQDSVDAEENRSARKFPYYLESIAPEAADKIIIHAFAHDCRVEIQDTVVRIRYGSRGNRKGIPDSAQALLTRREKEILDSALADMPGGFFGTGYLKDCDAPLFYLSAYGIKRVGYDPCLYSDMAPDNPLAVLGPILRTACLRHGIPDVTDRGKGISREELEEMDVR